jgi:hypothetical protein
MSSIPNETTNLGSEEWWIALSKGFAAVVIIRFHRTRSFDFLNGHLSNFPKNSWYASMKPSQHSERREVVIHQNNEKMGTRNEWYRRREIMTVTAGEKCRRRRARKETSATGN